MSKVTVEKVLYLGWKNCLKISDGKIELIVTTAIGPRIMRFGFVGGPNHMKVYENQAGNTGSSEWQIYGGHRLWHSPEEMPRTYEKDNFPCTYRVVKNGAIIRTPLDTATGLQKEVEIRINAEDSTVELIHRIKNTNLWNVEYAAWALTVMDQGGRLVIPQPVEGPKFLANRNITFWTYTRFYCDI